jgi:hypothetical protein
MRGIKTIIHDTIINPFIHNNCNNSVNKILIQNSTKPSSYFLLEISTTILIKDKNTNIRAGAHNLFNNIYYNTIKNS